MKALRAGLIASGILIAFGALWSSVGPASPVVDCIDRDGDGYTDCAGDCDDLNPSIHPGAPEACNRADDDCDGLVDEGIDADMDTVADCFDNCPHTANLDQADADVDGVGDVCDNCLSITNPDQSNSDSDPYGNVCDNCPNVTNADQADVDQDGAGDICDTCPTIPNPGQDPMVCCQDCGMYDPAISFTTEQGKGSGLVSWRTIRELDVVGFNIIVLSQRGTRVQLNPATIPCEECVTGSGHSYSYIIPKHKSGHNVFIEMVRRSGAPLTAGPATRL